MVSEGFTILATPCVRSLSLRPHDTTTIAVDIAKEVLQIARSVHPGKVDKTHRFRREDFLGFFVNRPVATVVMEACGTAHNWGRRIEALGHRVVLLPPHLVL